MAHQMYLASRGLSRKQLAQLWANSKVTSGVEFEALRVEEPRDTTLFDVARFLDALPGASLCSALLYAPRIESTQRLMRAGELGLRGVVCVADSQSAGTGRGANSWVSDEGCLMFSFQVGLDKSQGSALPMMQYLVSLVLVQSIEALERGPPAPRIKWPNDIYTSEGHKMGGILCQSEYSKGRFVLTVGVGLNVSNQVPEGARSLAQLGYREVSRETLLAQFCAQWHQAMPRFLESGFAPFLSAYEAAWLHSGQRVQLPDESCATVRGLSPQGYLLAEDAEGNACELHPDGNSFDWFSGLISVKKST